MTGSGSGRENMRATKVMPTSSIRRCGHMLNAKLRAGWPVWVDRSPTSLFRLVASNDLGRYIDLVDYFIRGNAFLDEMLNRESVLMHPFVVGEVAMGNLKDRSRVLETLRDLPAVEVISDEDVLNLVAQENLGGTGLSYIDAHLLAAARRSRGSLIWTRDQRLDSVARRFGIAMDVEGWLQ